MPLVRRFYFLFRCCYGVRLKRKFPTVQQTADLWSSRKIFALCLRLLRGKKKYRFFWIYENKNIDLFCLGFLTLLMIAWCFWVIWEGQVSCRWDWRLGKWKFVSYIFSSTPWYPSCSMLLFFFLLNYFFNWIIVDLQCCVSFRYTAKWFSYTYIYLFFQTLYYKLLQNTGYRSLCYTVEPCWLAIFSTAMYIS